MPRPLRIEFPGATCLVTSRGFHQKTTADLAGSGNEAPPVFRSQEDRAVFLNILENVVARFGWLIHSYVLMHDHYHLIVELPDANLSKGMRQLNGIYTQHVNHRYQQQGPLFKGRFKSIVFEKQKYLLPLCRYVVTNPTRLAEPEPWASYIWSSYRSTAGQVQKPPPMLHTADVLNEFGKRKTSSQRKYREYIHAGVKAPSPLDQRSHQVLLGGAAFIKKMRPILLGKLAQDKKPPQAAPRRKSLNSIFKQLHGKPRAERNRLICQAYSKFDYTQVEIGKHLGLHHTTIGKVISAGRTNQS